MAKRLERKDVSDADLDEAVSGFIANRRDVCFQDGWMVRTLGEAGIEVAREDVAMSMLRIVQNPQSELRL